jgi:hypothetical protein
MEKQVYPVRHYSIGGPLVKPYDITPWSFPLHRGLVSVEMNEKIPELEKDLKQVGTMFRLANPVPKSFHYAVLPSSDNGSYKTAFSALGQNIKVQRTTSGSNKDGQTIPAGSFVLEYDPMLVQLLESNDSPVIYSDKLPESPLEEVRIPRIALIETWFDDMDAGWTRYLLDSYHVPFTVLRPGDVKTTDLKSAFDVLLFPGNDKNVLLEGKYKGENGAVVFSEMPPEYTKGMTTEGLNKILSFLNEGGHIVSWGESASLFTGALTIKKGEAVQEEFQLPFSNVGEILVKGGLYAPGDLVRIELTGGHPLTYGMQEEVNIFYRGRTAFVTSVPVFDTDRRVIGFFPDDNVLQSGYIENPELLKGKSAMVWIKKGEGQLVLLAFSPAFRASTQGSYKLLFNSILIK